eukprot:jgi/Chrzof1/9162/Cz03g38090.t1
MRSHINAKSQQRHCSTAVEPAAAVAAACAGSYQQQQQQQQQPPHQITGTASQGTSSAAGLGRMAATASLQPRDMFTGTTSMTSVLQHDQQVHQNTSSSTSTSSSSSDHHIMITLVPRPTQHGEMQVLPINL